jgi:hypothetical protein
VVETTLVYWPKVQMSNGKPRVVIVGRATFP